MTAFHDDMTLGEARELLRQLVEDGETCPCCTQMAKVYRRKIHATMARALIVLYRADTPGEFVHAPSLPGDTHEISQLVWWNLIIEEPALRPDGGRVGWWATTERGGQFVRAEISIPKYARVYDHRRLGMIGDPVTIHDCLNDKFDYGELMGS